MLGVVQLALTAAIVVLANPGGLATGGGQYGRPTPAPPVPDRYAFLYQMVPPDGVQASFPIESIRIERSGCFGSCPVYSATIRADGTASYFGGRHAPRSGSQRGEAPFLAFARLAYFVERSGFAEMQEYYVAGWTDDETVTVTVTWRDGRRRSVSDYGRFGPPDLWILQQAIDAVVDRVRWE